MPPFADACARLPQRGRVELVGWPWMRRIEHGELSGRNRLEGGSTTGPPWLWVFRNFENQAHIVSRSEMTPCSNGKTSR
jgi:hypothetical protein